VSGAAEEALIQVEEALERVLAAASPLPAEELPLEACAGRALAADLVADHPLPGFASSAMDGFALRATDAAAATPDHPVALPIAFEVAAGTQPPALTSRKAARIFTGAAIPPGADAIVMQEDVSVAADAVTFRRAPAPGDHIRPSGEDLSAGAVALPRGTTLGPAELGLAAALGHATLLVVRAPRVALLTTGDELVPIGQPLGFAGVYDSNGPALAAAARAAGADRVATARARDDLPAIRAALEKARGADLLITVAGVSVGDRDLVRAALADLGVTLGFWRVAMRPGKPVAFGLFEGRPVLGLPGNPVSALVTFELFARPLLRRLGGHLGPDRRFVQAILQSAVKKPPHLALYCRGRCDGTLFFPSRKQGSGLLTSIALQDALAELPVGPSAVAAGETVRVRLLT
jgi:molybdopterin molybdotransferase